MPIGAATTYPILSDITLLARSLVNDTFPGATGTPGEGQIFTNTAPFTIPMVNSAIRELWREMGNNGVATLIQDNLILTGLGPVNGPLGPGISDPSVQVSITYSGYNDGSGVINTSQKLQANVLSVIEMWERQTGTNNEFSPMTQALDGLPGVFQGPWLSVWEYRQDGIYMLGSTSTEDVRYRAVVQLPGNVTGDGTDFASLSVPILDCSDALAWKLVKLYSFRLGTDALQYADAQAQEATRQLISRQVRQKQGVDYQQPSYGIGNFGYSDGTGYYG